MGRIGSAGIGSVFHIDLRSSGSISNRSLTSTTNSDWLRFGPIYIGFQSLPLYSNLRDRRGNVASQIERRISIGNRGNMLNVFAILVTKRFASLRPSMKCTLEQKVKDGGSSSI